MVSSIALDHRFLTQWSGWILSRLLTASTWFRCLTTITRLTTRIVLLLSSQEARGKNNDIERQNTRGVVRTTRSEHQIQQNTKRQWLIQKDKRATKWRVNTNEWGRREKEEEEPSLDVQTKNPYKYPYMYSLTTLNTIRSVAVALQTAMLEWGWLLFNEVSNMSDYRKKVTNCVLLDSLFQLTFWQLLQVQSSGAFGTPLASRGKPPPAHKENEPVE